MALWYRTGTIGVTNGSAAVAGTGTAWVDARINPGDALHAPDGRVYEIASVGGAGEITLVSTYLGSTASAQAYAIQPTRAVVADWRASAQALVDAYAGYAAGPLAGKWPAGTAALPAFAGASDPDTGLFFPAANQIGAATAGVLRWLLSSTEFQISVPITGTAVTQSATDTTPGRLPTVGWMGIGAATPGVITDLNNAANGSIQTNVTGTNAPGGTATAWTVMTLGYSTTAAVQYAYRLLSGAVYRRLKASGVWGPWYQVLDQQTLIGTVSQSGGVPTGALIERGSNGNGAYVRFADGTQICWHSLAGSSGAGVTWTFPAAFVSTTIMVGGIAAASVVSCPVLDSAPSTTAVVFSTRDKTDARRTDTVRLTAIGRWF